MSRFPSLCLVAALLTGGLTLYWRWPAAEAVPAASGLSFAVVAEPMPPALAVPAPVPAEPAPLPSATPLPSLAGTEVDGRLQTDAAGNLVLELALRDYFDYFLSAVDHSGLDASIAALLISYGVGNTARALAERFGLSRSDAYARVLSRR